MHLLLQKILIILSVIFLSCFQICAEDHFNPPHSIPSPCLYGVNVMSGQMTELIDTSLKPKKYERYEEGWNQSGRDKKELLFLSNKDFRLGRIKTILLSSEDDSSADSSANIQFSYEPGITTIYDFPGRETVYRYSSNLKVLEMVEHYELQSSGKRDLYRRERFFWINTDQENPLLSSRVLEDGKGRIMMCYCFYYNPMGQVTKETIAGQLTGLCSSSCVVDINGYPLMNGIETYSKIWVGSEENWDSKTDQLEKEDAKKLRGHCFSPRQHLKNPEEFDHFDQYKESEVSFLDASHLNIPRERYNSWGQLIATLDACGNETTYSYDFLGRLISTQSPAVIDAQEQFYHPTVKQRYNVLDQMIETIDANQNKIVISYTLRGQPIQMIYPDESKESYTYFLDGALKEKICRDGLRYSYERDQDNRVNCVKKYSSLGNLLQTLNYTYQRDLVEMVTDNQTFKVYFLYDDKGRQVGERYETADGVRLKEWSYDKEGNKTELRVQSGLDQGDNRQSDVLDQEKKGKHSIVSGATPFDMAPILEESSDPSSHFIFTNTSSLINSLGQVVKQEERVDRWGLRQVITYDAQENLDHVMKYNSMGLKISEVHYRYDGHGNKVFEKHYVVENGIPTRLYMIQWTYDSCHRVISLAEGNEKERKITRYNYNTSGQLSRVIKPDGVALNYSYLENGFLDKFEASDRSFSYQYIYDELQHLIEIKDLCQNFSQTRRYNAFQELIEEQQSPYATIGHRYDLAGRPIKLILPDQSSIAYRYQGKQLSKVERIQRDGKLLYKHSYGYDEKGLLKTSQLLNEMGEVFYRFDQKSRMISIDSPWSSQKIEGDSLDCDERVLQMTSQDSSGKRNLTFSYTEEGQIAKENDHQYTYDSLYNRLSEDGKTLTVNGLNQLIQTSDFRCVYDPNGNLVEKYSENERLFYTYDALNRLIRVEFPDVRAVTYLYDAFDRRLEKKTWEWHKEDKEWKEASLEIFIYDGFKEIGKVDSQGVLKELRVLGQGKGAELGASIAIELNGNLFVPIHDLSGSVSCMVDAREKKVVENYHYNAFGMESILDDQGQILDSSRIGNPWRYHSKRKDNHTGLIFFGKREYDPHFGRWITQDPLLFCETPNLYAYVKNDPLNCTDHYGLFSISEVWSGFVDNFFSSLDFFRTYAQETKERFHAQLKLPSNMTGSLEKIGKTLIGESTYLLMGAYAENTHVSEFGDHEVSPKVRMTFINGILNTKETLLQTLEAISESHGGVKIHYVFRPTQGWTRDISLAIMVKVGYKMGFKSVHAHLLAQMWRDLIQEMGGVDGGGIIIHYAHSLGGSETDRACELLSSEEQKMIRVVTFGSATVVRHAGFKEVLNMVSVNDGVCGFLLEPIGNIRSYFDPDSTVRYHGSFSIHGFLFGSPSWPLDHLLSGATYAPIIQELGKEFVAEFGTIPTH